MDKEARQLARESLQELIAINGWEAVGERDWPMAYSDLSSTLSEDFESCLVRMPRFCLVAVRCFPVSVGEYNRILWLFHDDGRIDCRDQEGNRLEGFPPVPWRGRD